MKSILLLIAILFHPAMAFTACQPMAFSAYASAPGINDGGGWVSLEYKTYTPMTSFSFPWTVPDGHQFFLTDILFQAKNIPGQRPSYLVLNNLYTLTSDLGQIHFRTPLILPAGFMLTGAFGNNTTDSSVNIIALVNGILVDSPECWAKWK